jgi:hypothetical protein
MKIMQTEMQDIRGQSNRNISIITLKTTCYFVIYQFVKKILTS